MLLCIQTGKTVNDTNRMRFVPGFHLKSALEMREMFPYMPEQILDQAMSNTVAIAERCQFELEFGHRRLPVFEPPAGFTPETYLRHLCREMLPRRYRS